MFFWSLLCRILFPDTNSYRDPPNPYAPSYAFGLNTTGKARRMPAISKKARNAGVLPIACLWVCLGYVTWGISHLIANQPYPRSPRRSYHGGEKSFRQCFHSWRTLPCYRRPQEWHNGVTIDPPYASRQCLAFFYFSSHLPLVSMYQSVPYGHYVRQLLCRLLFGLWIFAKCDQVFELRLIPSARPSLTAIDAFCYKIVLLPWLITT